MPSCDLDRMCSVSMMHVCCPVAMVEAFDAPVLRRYALSVPYLSWGRVVLLRPGVALCAVLEGVKLLLVLGGA